MASNQVERHPSQNRRRLSFEYLEASEINKTVLAQASVKSKIRFLNSVVTRKYKTLGKYVCNLSWYIPLVYLIFPIVAFSNYLVPTPTTVFISYLPKHVYKKHLPYQNYLKLSRVARRLRTALVRLAANGIKTSRSKWQHKWGAQSRVSPDSASQRAQSDVKVWNPNPLYDPWHKSLTSPSNLFSLCKYIMRPMRWRVNMYAVNTRDGIWSCSCVLVQ